MSQIPESHQLEVPASVTFVANNNTRTGHIWTVQFEGGERATVTATHNPNGSTTYRILEIIQFFTLDKSEIEEMIAQYAEVGNWEQEK